MTKVESLKAVLDLEGARLTAAKRDLKRFNIEVSAAKILRKSIAAQLTELRKEIRSGVGGHKVKAAVAAANFLRDQYQQLLLDAQGYKFQRGNIRGFIEQQKAHVQNLDAMWEAEKLEEAK